MSHKPTQEEEKKWEALAASALYYRVREIGHFANLAITGDEVRDSISRKLRDISTNKKVIL